MSGPSFVKTSIPSLPPAHPINAQQTSYSGSPKTSAELQPPTKSSTDFPPHQSHPIGDFPFPSSDSFNLSLLISLLISSGGRNHSHQQNGALKYSTATQPNEVHDVHFGTSVKIGESCRRSLLQTRPPPSSPLSRWTRVRTQKNSAGTLRPPVGDRRHDLFKSGMIPDVFKQRVSLKILCPFIPSPHGSIQPIKRLGHFAEHRIKHRDL